MPTNHRDMMAPDTDPTDEELEAVAKEALLIATDRRTAYERWISTTLQAATPRAESQPDAPSPPKSEQQ